MSKLNCLNKSVPVIQDFIRYFGDENALRISNRCKQITGNDSYDLFLSNEFKDSVEAFGATETFRRINEAFHNDRLNKFFNLSSFAGIEDDTTLIEMQETRSKANDAQNNETLYVTRNDELQNMLNEEWQKFSKENELEKLEFNGVKEVYMTEKWLNEKKVTLTDYNVIKQAITDIISSDISSFLYNFDAWAFIHNFEEDTPAYKRMLEISRNRDIKKFLSISTCTFKDLFYNAIEDLKLQSLVNANKSKAYIYDILADDSYERDSIVALLQSQVRNKINDIYDIKVKNNSVASITLDQLNLEDDIDIFDSKNDIEEVDKGDVDEATNEEEKPSEEFDVIGTMLSLKDDLNWDRAKNDKQLIIQLFSGIPNKMKNDISPYGEVHYYSPWNIFNQLAKECHDCTDSDDLKNKLKSLSNYPYTKDILERIESSNKFATLAWKTLRGQYRIFFDVEVGDNDIYGLKFPNFQFNGMFYKYAITDYVERKKDSGEQTIFNVDNKVISYNSNYRSKELEPLFKSIKNQYNIISSTPSLKTSGHSFSASEKAKFIANIRAELSKPIRELNNHSFMDAFKTLINRLGCQQLGFDITDTELLGIFTSFTCNYDSYGNEYYTYLPIFTQTDGLRDQIENALNATGVSELPNMFDFIGTVMDTQNSFVLSEKAHVNLVSYFYRGKDGYYSFSYQDKLSRRFTWLTSLTNGEYINWYEQQYENDNYFKAYHDANELVFEDENKRGVPVSNHSVLYKLYKDAKAGKKSAKLIPSDKDNIQNFQHLNFAVQDGKKFSELSKYDIIINKLAAYINNSRDTIKDDRSLYTSYALSDKSRQVAFVNYRDNRPSLCLKSLAAKSMMEIMRMVNIYNSIVQNKKDNKLRKQRGEEPLELTNEPRFSAEINEVNGKYLINFNNNGGIRFAYLPALNEYLYEINNVVGVDENGEAKLNHTHNYTSVQLKFISNLYRLIYDETVNKEEEFKNVCNTFIKVDSNKDNIIALTLNSEAASLKKTLLEFPSLLDKLGFVFDKQSNEYKLTGINEHHPLYKTNLDALINQFVYNSDASLAEQTFIFHNDIVRYGSAKAFSKRANELISNGQEIDKTARDINGELYDNRTNITQGKKVEITWANVKSKKFIQNPEFYNSIANIMTTQGNASNRPKEVEANKKEILNSTIEAADGQSIISIAYKKRYLGQLGKLSYSEEKIYNELIDIYDKASNFIEQGRFDLLDKLKERINNLYKQEYKTNFISGSIKQFSSTVVNNPATKRSTATEYKNSEVCLDDLKTLLETKNYFMIRLMAHMNRNGIDCINDETTVKEGIRKVFNPSFDNFFEEFDAIMADKNNIDLDLVTLMPMEDVALVQETPAHAMDREDIFGTQITRLIPATIDRSGNTEYYLYKFGKDEQEAISGDDLYKKIQSVLNIKIKNNIDKVFDKFGISNEIYNKIEKNEPLTEEEKTRLNRKLSDILKTNSKFSDTDYRFFVDPVTGKFAYPINEFTSATELSKTIASVIKNDIIANNVKGGQLVQVTNALNELFYRLKNGESKDSPEVRKLLDESLECKIEYYPDGSLKEVYMEAEIPFMYKDAINEYIDKDGNIDMNKVPEELKHGIFYRIPTEGLCSIFHIKVKRFTYGMADHVKLPVEITKLAGLDFDIDKLFTFIAAMKKNKEGKLEYVKPDLNDLESNKTSEQANNALFELMLTALNSPTGVNGYNEFGGYEPLKYKGLAIFLAIEEATKTNKDIKQCYDNAMKLSNKQIEDLFSNYNKTQSPCSVITNINIQESNFESKDMLGKSANGNALAAELSQLNVHLNTSMFGQGVKIGSSEIIKTTSTKFAPKNTVNNTNSCQNIIRQPLAASADVGKEAFLNLIGFNNFSIGIWSSLMNLGCELEDALLFMQHPIVRYLSDKYKQMNFKNEFGARPLNVLTKNSILASNSKSSDYDELFLGRGNKRIEISTDSLINSLTQSYDEFCNYHPNTAIDIEKLIYFLLKNNQEVVTLSPFLKMDSKSNISWNSTFGLLATIMNFEQFAKDVEAPEVITTFSKEILDVFGYKKRNTENTIPRLATIYNEIPVLVTTILHNQNQHIFEKLNEVASNVVDQTGAHLNESDVKDIYNLYNYAMLSLENNFLNKYFKNINLEKRGELLKSIIADKDTFINKYPDNAFIKNIDIDKITSSTLEKYKNQLKGINSNKTQIDPTKLSKSNEDDIRTDLIKLLLSDDEEIKEFINKIFIISIMQSGFNKYTSKSPLRYFNEIALANVLDKDYIRYFSNNTYDEMKLDSKFSLNDLLVSQDINVNSLKLTEYIIRSLPNLIKSKSSAKEGKYYKNKDGAIFKPILQGEDSVIYQQVSKLSVLGVLLEAFSNIAYNITDASEFSENTKRTKEIQEPVGSGLKNTTFETWHDTNNIQKNDQTKQACNNK